VRPDVCEKALRNFITAFGDERIGDLLVLIDGQVTPPRMCARRRCVVPAWEDAQHELPSDVGVTLPKLIKDSEACG
jgi:hypothetical protein